tara:strand:- start:5290 stop:5994 length:705 start_codon:yes stop_codon:yes gene_type:complete
MKALFFLFVLTLSFSGYSSTILLEQVPLPDVSPTTYFIADETKVSCSGSYAGVEYYGDEKSEVLTPGGELIAEVCTRFFKVLSMEGTGRLKDRGNGSLTVNWAGSYTFRIMEKCIFGEGVQKDLCLIPYHTIAADLESHELGGVVFIPKAKGLMLPDGRIHNGLFLVRDTGGAFRGRGFNRIDLFVGNQNDENNVFIKAGMSHREKFSAYKLEGSLKQAAIDFFTENFPTLFIK